MRTVSASTVILKVLGLLLLTAAMLKGHELLTVPVVHKDFWSWRPFLVFQVEFELGLGIWLLSGLFRRLAWLAGLLCFGLFCGVTLYKGLTGAASCGCFGTVHVNPWVTLLAVDLPAVAALGLVRPRPALMPWRSRMRGLPATGIGVRESFRRVLAQFAQPLPSLPRLVATAALGLALLGLTTPILALNEPPTITFRYEVLEPQTWVGQRLPILEHIDIAEKLGTGPWLVVLYHHDCPDCRRALPEYEQMAGELREGVRMALIEMAPYDPQRRRLSRSACTLGQLSTDKEWIVKTPVVCLLADAHVVRAWEGEAPAEEEMSRTGLAGMFSRKNGPPDHLGGRNGATR